MRNLFFLILIAAWSSCVPHKNVVYFGDLPRATSDALDIPAPPELRLRTGDLVEINITSISRETNTFFEKPGTSGDGPYAPNVFQINSNGAVDIPLIGEVELAGKTTEEAQDFLRSELLSYVQKPSVNVRLVSFRITVLGEVRTPGVYSIPDGRVSVLEAVGYAGDLTIYGKRDNVLIIRNVGDEKRHLRINLNDSSLLNGDAFYLQNNDVVYIEPSRGKTSGDDNVYRLLPLVLSGLTFVVVIISLTQ